MRISFNSLIIFILLVPYFAISQNGNVSKNSGAKRYLYVAVPGIRDYLGFGGHGVLVFDIDNNHKFVKRI